MLAIESVLARCSYSQNSCLAKTSEGNPPISPLITQVQSLTLNMNEDFSTQSSCFWHCTVLLCIENVPAIFMYSLGRGWTYKALPTPLHQQPKGLARRILHNPTSPSPRAAGTARDQGFTLTSLDGYRIPGHWMWPQLSRLHGWQNWEHHSGEQISQRPTKYPENKSAGLRVPIYTACVWC